MADGKVNELNKIGASDAGKKVLLARHKEVCTENEDDIKNAGFLKLVHHHDDHIYAEWKVLYCIVNSIPNNCDWDFKTLHLRQSAKSPIEPPLFNF